MASYEGYTPESVERRRQVADALLRQVANNQPRNVGEGLGYLGNVLLQAAYAGQAQRGEDYGAKQRAQAFAPIAAMLGGDSTYTTDAPGAGATVGGTAGASSTGRATAGADMGSNGIFSEFMGEVGKGITNPYGLAAVAATGKAESGFSGGNIGREWSDPSESGQAGNAGGILSWRAERLNNLKNFNAKQGGSGLGSAATQAQFFLQENPALVAALNNAQSVEEAQGLMNGAWKFAGYNRAGGEAGRRLSVARALLGQFQNGAGDPSPVQVASLDPSAGMDMMPDRTANVTGPLAQNLPSTIPVPSFRPEAEPLADAAPGRAKVAAALATQGGNQPAPATVAQAAPTGYGVNDFPPAPPPYAPGNGAPPSGSRETATIMQFLANPWADDGQKRVAMALLEQRQAAEQAARAQAFERWKIQDARAYDASKTADEREYQTGILVNKNRREDARFAVTDRNADRDFDLRREQANKPPTSVQEYEYYRNGEVAAGRTPMDFNTWDTQGKKAGAMQINTGNNSSKFTEESDKAAAGRLNDIVQAGTSANQFMGDIETLSAISTQLQTGKGAEFKRALGPYAQMFGIDIGDLGEAQAYQAIIDRLAPQMRAPGSGATSDFDARQFLSSLPQLGNSPEGNKIITETLTAMQKSRMAAADIASKAFLPEQAGGIPWQEAEKQIRALGNPYQRFNEYRKRVGTGKPSTVSGSDTARPQAPIDIGRIPQRAQDKLRADPNRYRSDFDAKFGPGSAARVLGE